MGPLVGLRVLELATLNAGPTLGAMLGDLGADVVKVEPPDGEDFRVMNAAAEAAGRPTMWTMVGRNKRMIVVDHKEPEGVDLLRRLTTVADVVVLNQPAKVLARMDCTYEAISGRNPRAVVVHVSGYGATGPYADRIGNGTLGEAFAGLTHLTRLDDGTPHLSPPLLGDNRTALAGVIGPLAACYWRDVRGGPGQYVDVALYESVLAVLAPQLVAWDPEVAAAADGAAGDGPPKRSGPGIRATFRTADARWVLVTAYSNSQITRLLDALGVEVGGGDGGADLASLVEGWIAANPLETVLDAFTTARIGITPVNDFAGLVADAHVQARGAVVEVDDPRVGTVRIPRPAPRLSETPGEIRWTARPLGADTAAVLEEWLGLGDDPVGMQR
jgi:formyl-CoA transferase